MLMKNKTSLNSHPRVERVGRVLGRWLAKVRTNPSFSREITEGDDSFCEKGMAKTHNHHKKSYGAICLHAV